MVLVLLFFITATLVQAQCPMCKLAAESNLKEGGDKGLGLNTGILYLLAMPMIFGGLVTIVVVRQHRQDRKAIALESSTKASLN